MNKSSVLIIVASYAYNICEFKSCLVLCESYQIAVGFVAKWTTRQYNFGYKNYKQTKGGNTFPCFGEKKRKKVFFLFYTRGFWSFMFWWLPLQPNNREEKEIESYGG